MNPSIADVRQLVLQGRIDSAAKLYAIVARLWGGDPDLTIYRSCGFTDRRPVQAEDTNR